MKFNIFSLHPFFFAIFPILSMYSYNVGIVSIESLFVTLGITLLCVLIFVIILKFIFNKSHKTSLILSIGIISFFFYGHLFNLILELNLVQHVYHRFVLIPYSLFFIIPTIFLIRTKKKLDNTNKIITSISVVLIIIASSNILLDYTFSDEYINSSLMNENFVVDVKPDIYYIILDAYGDDYTLERHFQYDNSDFTDYLFDKGFQFSTPSYSNYQTTYLSIPSSLNLNYVNELVDENNSSFNVISANRLIDRNILMKTMGENGYVNINFDSGWGPTRNISIADLNLCGHNSFLSSEFLIGIAETSMLKPIYAKFLESSHRERILCTLSELPVISKNIEKPIFVFAHLMLPHPPYIFDSSGNSTSIKSLQLSSDKIINEKNLYLEQLQYTNLRIKEIVDQLTSENSIIIIQSDHGPPDSIFDLENDNSTDKDKLRNINYYYFPDNKKIIYDGITPVNSFRIIFQNYFESNLELLPDQNFYIDEKINQYELIEITNELLN